MDGDGIGQITVTLFGELVMDKERADNAGTDVVVSRLFYVVAQLLFQ